MERQLKSLSNKQAHNKTDIKTVHPKRPASPDYKEMQAGLFHLLSLHVYKPYPAIGSRTGFFF